MDKSEVLKIFASTREKFLRGKIPSESPTAYILGGQPASGKSNLNSIAEQNSPALLRINGDTYRMLHPLAEQLQIQPEIYPQETQIFSSVFTEGLIDEAIKRRLNVSVEGTMRRPEVVLNTATLFREAGFRTEALCIVAPLEYSYVNTYYRYATSLEKNGSGRLAPLESINISANGLPKTLDALHQQKAVDSIRIFDIYANKQVKRYDLVDGNWNDPYTPPSMIVRNAIDNQKRSPELLAMYQARAEKTVSMLKEQAPALVMEFTKVAQQISAIAKATTSILNHQNSL